jgi:hypothetical protein
MFTSAALRFINFPDPDAEFSTHMDYCRAQIHDKTRPGVTAFWLSVYQTPSCMTPFFNLNRALADAGWVETVRKSSRLS